MRTRNIFIALVVIAGPLALPSTAQDPARQLHVLLQERHEWSLREFPARAMSRGDYSNADKIADVSLAAIERRHATSVQHFERLKAIDRAKLGENDRVNYDLFAHQLRNGIAGHQFRTYLAPIGLRSGVLQSIPQMHERVRFKNARDYANYLTRLEKVPGMIHQTIGLMVIGLKEGRTPPQVTLAGVPGQFETLLSGGLDRLAEPFERLPNSIELGEARALRKRFDERSLPAVKRAMTELRDFVVREYVPGCRTSIAAHDLPDGEAYYRHRLRVFTTTDMSAEQIHQLGLREVARIRAEMMEVIRSSDFMLKTAGATTLEGDELFKAFLKYLRTDPRFYHQTAEQLLAGYRDICKRVDAHLPKLFKTLPRLTYGVREIPAYAAPDQTTAYYSRGDIRNAQPGYFYANTFALDQRPKYEMIALALHEAVPGHHFQVAIAQELEDVPEFRKDAWFTAFGEGWALYAERLGVEMGLYEDPYDNFGRLLYEMWRSCRLVVDTGMHALGWSRERAMQFLTVNTALSELNIKNEIDRYISWPGQATAYKIGELKIRELRERAEATMGDRFDLREFHDLVLGAGSLPLDLLEKRVDEWIRNDVGATSSR